MKNAIAARVVHLFEKSQHVPTVANWIYNEFWADKGSYSSDDLAALLYRATGEDAIPLSLLALCADIPVGTVNLIEHDDENRQELTPWLAALYVLPEYRNGGVGRLLVRSLQLQAAKMGIGLMYLGTDNPGFYAHLEAQIHEQPSDDFCIMRLQTWGDQVTG